MVPSIFCIVPNLRLQIIMHIEINFTTSDSTCEMTKYCEGLLTEFDLRRQTVVPLADRKHTTWIWLLIVISSFFPESMTTVGQRWQTVVPLAHSWRWVHNVGPTLSQHQHVLDENWKATSFIVLALRRSADFGPT